MQELAKDIFINIEIVELLITIVRKSEWIKYCADSDTVCAAKQASIIADSDKFTLRIVKKQSNFASSLYMYDVDCHFC